VTVRLGVRADPDLLAAESPGVVIVATGAARALPAIPGVEAPHVRTVEQLLADGPDGERADRPEGAEAVVIGDDAPACQAAWLLQERGARVRLLATGEPAREIEGVTRRALLARLRERGVAVHESAQVERIEARAVHWVDAGGARHRSPVVAVVVSPAPEPDAALARRIEQAGWRVEAVGDCAAPGSILDAIHAAAAVAARI
jgi:thioredoxin reductase